MPGFLMHLIEGEMIINKINTGVTSAADSRLLAIKADPEQVSPRLYPAGYHG